MKTYHAVIIGAGNIGAFFDTPQNREILTHANAFYQNKHFRLMGFFDVDLEKSKQAAQRWNVKAYATLQEALQEADVVSCTVPDAYHYQILEQIADYPVKLVFAEKPLTKTREEAEKIYRLYKQKHIPLQVNYTRRYVTAFIKLKEELKQYGNFIRGTGYYGKGILHNGSHMLDFIAYLLGDIEQVSGKRPIIDYEKEDPSLEVELEVSGGSIYIHPVDCRVVTIFELDLFFEKARIRLLDGGMWIERYEIQESPVFTGYYNYRKVSEAEVDYGSAFETALNNIYQVLEQKESLICPIEDAKKVLELCCLLQQA